MTTTWGWIRAIAVCLGLSVLLAACGIHQQTAIYNVQDKPLPAAARGLSPYQIEAYINQATSAKGWKVDKIRPGELRATNDWDSHSATVTILITQGAYSIRHLSSVNLREADGLIHRQRNVRVQQLEDEIDRRLRAASS
jgi:hypothetical protein